MSAITTHRLTCGMPLILEQMSGVRSVGLTWLLPAGSATDPAEREGLCTMWSELLLRGAGDLDSREQADVFDKLGVSRSADVATQHLRLSCTLLGARLIEAMPLVVDMVRRPTFDEADIEPARLLALQAIEALKDDPHERAVLRIKERHNPSPLNRSGMGSVDGLTAITRKDLVDGWARQARPEGSVLALAGDLESAGGAARIIDGLEGLLSGWTGGQPRVETTPAPHRGTYFHEQDASSQVQIVLMHDGPAERDQNSRLERVVGNVLSGGMASRLFSEVREKRGLCYSVSASYATDREYGRCLAYVGTQPARAQESLDVLMSELRRVNTSDGRVTAEEFERAMIGIRANLVFSGESTGARAATLATDQYRLGRARSLDEIMREYAGVRIEDVNAYLSQRSMGEVTIVTLGPTALVRPA